MLHLPDKILLTGASFHGFPDVVHEPKFPALTLPGCPVFPGSHLFPSLLILGQDGEAVSHTDLVTELPKLPQGIGGLPQLSPSFKTHGIYHKVGVDILGIAVGSHQHLMPWPRLGSELQTNGMSLLIGDVFLGRKGLHILVEIDPVQFPVLFHIPPYTPEMNPIEHIWKEIRKRGFRNEVFATLEKVVDRLCDTICSLTTDTIFSITGRNWIIKAFN